MCGIAGVLYAQPLRLPSQAVLSAMGDAIAHRGPDADGFFIDPGLGLVHRRLSIIDLNSGDQPIANETGAVQIVFNGEIYNYQTLRSDLERRGHRFKTFSDTEVLVHLYEDEGERLVEKLRGMFVFALWDRNNRRLLLGRDRLGIKPLYIYRDVEKFVFASELKGILAHPDIPRQIDPVALEDYLAFGMVTGSRSIFRNFEKLPPAHTLSITANQLSSTPHRYWQLRFEPDETKSIENWQDEIRAKLDESVRLHLIADVPVGAFLSGGVDSSAIVATAANAGQGKLQTYSIGFREQSYSELPFARMVADRFKTNHVEEIVTPDAVELLDQLTHNFDEPFADASAVPTYLVSRLAARHVKVVLSGDGGDEAFGGYSRYAHDIKEAAIRRRLPFWFRRLLGRIAPVWPKADWLPRPLRAKTLLTNLALDTNDAYINTLSLCRPPLRRLLLAPDIAGSLNGHVPGYAMRSAFNNAPSGDALAGMLATDFETFLPDDFLVKVDRASMACGLEVRPPLLDHELLELSARIPSRLKVRNGRTKWIFSEAVRSRLPAQILDRPKQGFDIPVDAWLRGPLSDQFEDIVLATNSRVGDFINKDVVRQLNKAHQRGTGRHGNVLWAILVLSHWCNRYLKNAPTTAV